jgi:hypothetical protein
MKENSEDQVPSITISLRVVEAGPPVMLPPAPRVLLLSTTPGVVLFTSKNFAPLFVTIKKGLLSALSGRDSNDENDDAYPPGVNIVSRIIGDTMLYVFRELAQGNEIEVNTTTPNNTDC